MKRRDTVIILQVRVGSTRLPHKVLLPFSEQKSILDVIQEKLSFTERIVIATTTNPMDDIIEQYAYQHNLKCFRGSEHNVLKRFIEAAEFYGYSKIIRICSDNPFLDKLAIQQLFEMEEDTKSDYISFKVNNSPSIKTHFGFWGEWVSLEALKRIAEITENAFYYEHVTNYIYEHPNLFKIRWLDVDNRLKNRDNIRLTIDTQEDFERASKIYADLKHEEITIPIVVQYLDKHPEIIQSMEYSINHNQK
jgi:spore coat polysaccharide biosynthesis protein SpsF